MYCRYWWGAMWGMGWFIGIEEYKKGHLENYGISSKNKVFIIRKMYWKGVQKKDFGRHFSISSEIRGIF
jgi:hypothetical protein